jgi:hypothetical protein
MFGPHSEVGDAQIHIFRGSSPCSQPGSKPGFGRVVLQEDVGGKGQSLMWDTVERLRVRRPVSGQPLSEYLLQER